MQGGGAVGSEGAAVFGGGVAFVGGEAVLRVEEVEGAHEGVAVDLGDDGGGGDGEGEGVAVEEPCLGAVVVDAEGVDQEVVGREGEALDGEEHGEARGLVDVDAVDGVGIDRGYREGERRAADATVEAFTVFAGELLGVGEAGAGKGGAACGEDDGGGDDGSEEGSAADFVDAGDGGCAAIAEGLLRCVGADELAEHELLEGAGREVFRVREVGGGSHGDSLPEGVPPPVQKYAKYSKQVG